MKRRNPAALSLSNPGTMSGWAGKLRMVPIMVFRSSSLRATPVCWAVMSREAPAITPKSSYKPVTVETREFRKTVANQEVRTEASPKILSKCGSRAFRSSKVSFTSKTINFFISSPLSSGDNRGSRQSTLGRDIISRPFGNAIKRGRPLH